jgi:hypothetical protein
MNKVMPIIATGTVLALFSLVAYTGFIVGESRQAKISQKSLDLTKERLTYKNIKLKLQRDECFLFVTELIKQKPQTKETPEWY